MKKSNSDSFVPTFVIYINNIRLAQEKEIHVKEISLSENLNFPAMASVTLSDIFLRWQTDSDFNEGNSIKILLGYKDQLENLFEGVITGKKVQLSENSFLVLKCSDPLFRFNNAVKVRSFYNITSHEIIKKITQPYSFDFETDIKNKNFNSFIQYYKTDLEVLRGLCDYDIAQIFFKENKLFIKKIVCANDDETVLEWGKSLSEINAGLDCTSLITNAQVKSWNPEKTEVVKGKFSHNELSFRLEDKKSGQALFADNFGESADSVMIEDLKDCASCEEAACAILTKNSFNFIKASGKSKGNNKIKAGKVIKIKGIGDVFSGNYLVNSAKHILSDKGYKTEFGISKNC